MHRRSALVVALVAAVVVLLLARPWQGDDDPRRGSEHLGDGHPLEIGSAPSSYRITYRIEERAAGREGSERITVDRPFRSRRETFDGPRPQGDPVTVEVAALGRTARRSGDAGRVAIAIPPSVALADLRLDAVIDSAVGAGLVEVLEQRRILGRDCQVYRTGQPLGLGELVPPTDAAFVDVCIDRDGLVLEELDAEWRRIAIDVEVGVSVADATFDVGARTIPVDRGGGVVRELAPGSRTPDRFWELGDDLPLPHLGRFAVVPPQPEAFTDPTQRGRRVASVADVLADDVDVVVVERGGSLQGVDVLGRASEHARRVDVGELGEAEVVLTSAGAEITVRLGGGRFVRVTGTLPVEQLTAVASGLHEVDGGELKPVGEAW